MLEVEYLEDGEQISRIKLRLKNVNFDIEMRGHITVLEGDSSTGKSYLFKTIDADFANNQEAYKNMGIDKVLLVDSGLMRKLSHSDLLMHIIRSRNSLILIDNADTILGGAGDLLDYIALDSDNYYIFNSRRGLGLPISLNHFGELEQDGDTVKTVFQHNVFGWK